MKKLPIGIQTLSEIIDEGYIYVDKTAQVHTIVSAGKYYFLSRPRRFGKSLLVSTFEALFAGNRPLFKNLAIDSLPWEWKKHPIVKISFASIAYETVDALKHSLLTQLNFIAASYKVTLTPGLLPGDTLKQLIITLAEQQKVVLLIDEYDYAILKHVHKPDIADQMREVLMGFYGVIKDLDPYLRFVFLTGVSKFSKTAIFSGLNNLQDLTLDDRAATLLGYTEKEIIDNFPQYLNLATQELNLSEQELLKTMRVWYDGYWFTKKTRHADGEMYNPFSVLNFLQKKTFSNYWFESGTPTFLINLIKTKNYPVIQDFEQIKISEAKLGSFTIDNIYLPTLLYQTGYLTIKSYDPHTELYTLGYPNREVSRSLIDYLFESLTTQPDAKLRDLAYKLHQAFEQKNYHAIQPLLTQFFADIPYTIQLSDEKYYQTIFYFVLKMIGADIIVEEPTNVGRIDGVLQTPQNIFIIEFKINDSAAHAIAQIVDKNYAQKYTRLDKKIVLVGIAFDTTTKNVSEIVFKDL